MRHTNKRFSVAPIDYSLKDKTQAEQIDTLLRTVNELVEQHNELAKFAVDNQENIESQVESVIERHVESANALGRAT